MFRACSNVLLGGMTLVRVDACCQTYTQLNLQVQTDTSTCLYVHIPIKRERGTNVNTNINIHRAISIVRHRTELDIEDRIKLNRNSFMSRNTHMYKYT